MIPLLDTSADLAQCSAELGCRVGQLLTPLTRFSLRDPFEPWAIDNGAYAGFNARAFLSLLTREQERRQHCAFVAVPDVVGSARRTREVFEHWRHEIHGYRLAYVCQDGQEDIEIPWPHIHAIFVGGSDKFKESVTAVACIRAAQALGKWVHVGRVNTPARWSFFEKLGADSCDGSGMSQYSHMRVAIAEHSRIDQSTLFEQHSPFEGAI